jgi:hypothetical protein
VVSQSLERRTQSAERRIEKEKQPGRTSLHALTPKVGTLYEGDHVEVLDKKKNWTLVVSVNNRNVGGWVLSRCIESVPPAKAE